MILTFSMSNPKLAMDSMIEPTLFGLSVVAVVSVVVVGVGANVCCSCWISCVTAEAVFSGEVSTIPRSCSRIVPLLFGFSVVDVASVVGATCCCSCWISCVSAEVVFSGDASTICASCSSNVPGEVVVVEAVVVEAEVVVGGI